MMHTILGGLLNTCVLLTMFYSCPAIWLNAALSNSSICMCLLIMICLFIHLAALLACLLACFFDFFVYLVSVFVLSSSDKWNLQKDAENPCR